MNRLTEIANNQKTDKGTIYEESHGYTVVYEKYIPNNGGYNLLELGIDKGSSIRMWKEYNPYMKLYMADHNPATLQYFDNSLIEKYYKVEQTVRDTLNTIPQDVGENFFDYIIDDGAHFMHTHHITLSVLLKSLKSGGVYFIEDLQTCKMKDFCKSENDSTVNILKNWVSTGNFNSPFLNELENEYIGKNIKSVTFECNDKLGIITKL